MKINTVDYQNFRSGIIGNYNPKTGLLIVTMESNIQGDYSARKIRMELTPGERTVEEIEDILEETFYCYPERMKILKKGYIVS